MGARDSAGQKRAFPVTVEERRSMATADSPRRKVPIAWEALEDAFENNAPEVHSYLHLVTGEVIRVVDGVADPATHARIAADSHYMRVEPVSSREQYRCDRLPRADDRPALSVRSRRLSCGAGVRDLTVY